MVIINRVKIYIKFFQYFLLYRKTLRLGRKIISSKKIIFDENELYTGLIIFMITKSYQSLKSVYLLCKHGLTKEAMPIIRTLLEGLINLAYIKESSNERTKLYLDYDYHLKLKHWKILIKSKAMPDQAKNKYAIKIAQYQAEWDKVKHNYLNSNRKIGNTWSLLSIESMAQKTGLGNVYDWAYRYCSSYSHVNSRIINSYLLGYNKNKELVTTMGESYSLIKEGLATSAVVFLELLKIANDKYSAGFTEEIDSIYIKWANINKDVVNKRLKQEK